MPILTAFALLGMLIGFVGCAGAPGANGEYATHDRGYLTRGPGHPVHSRPVAFKASPP